MDSYQIDTVGIRTLNRYIDSTKQIYDIDLDCSVIHPISDPIHYFGQSNVIRPLPSMLDIVTAMYTLDFRMIANQVKKIDDI